MNRKFHSPKKALILALCFMMITSLVLPLTASASKTTPKNGIGTIDELNGKEIGVQTAVLYEELLLERIPDAHWNYYTMPNDMIMALESGKVDAYLIEEAGYLAQIPSHPELMRMDEIAGECPFSIVVGESENQDKMVKQMNDFIDKGYAEGWLSDMYDYWVLNFDADTSTFTKPEITGENGTLSFAVEGGYEPFSFMSHGELSGFDIEFIYRFCHEYGYAPDFHEVPFESIAPGVETGMYDFGMNIAFSDERSGAAVLTNTYYTCKIVMVVEGVTMEAKNGITTLDELDGKDLGVQTAVLYEELLTDRLPNAKWQYYTMPNDMIMALESDKVAAYLIEEAGYLAQLPSHPELMRLDEYAGECPFSIVVGDSADQAKLVKQMNDFIDKGYAEGWLSDMYDYWVLNFDADTSTFTKPEVTGENGTLSFAVEGGYEPFSFMSHGELSGFDIEFIYRFCHEYGYAPEFHEVPFESIAPGVETGMYDFGMNIAFSDERNGAAVLTNTYYTCNVVMVVEGVVEQKLTGWAKFVNSFEKTFIKDNRWQMFVEGTGVTVLITLLSVLFGTILGFIVYMLCRHGNKVANLITSFLSWLIDGIPTVVFLMILFYVVFGKGGLSGTGVSIFGFTLIFGVAMYDMLCVGCNAISKGQTEAARALGYSDSKCFFKIILPQAAQHFLPIYKNELVGLIKETSIVGYIAVLDLTKISDLVRSRTYEAFFALIATAIVYLIIESIMTYVVSKVEDAIDPKHRSKEKILKGITIQD